MASHSCNMLIQCGLRENEFRFLPQMQLLLLQPNYTTRPRAYFLQISKHFMIDICSMKHPLSLDVAVMGLDRPSDCFGFLSITISDSSGSFGMLTNFKFNRSDFLIGSQPVLVIQRAWRRFCEERRLAVCMAGCDEHSLLGCVVRTLCVEDLRRMSL